MAGIKRACGPPLFILTCASLFMSSLSFIFSMLHLGYDSFFTIPTVFGVTVVYHATVLTMEYRNSTRLEAAPSTTLASVVCAAVVSALWLGAFTVILLVSVLFGAKAIIVAERQALWLLVVQCLLSFTEAMIMLAIVVRTSYERQQGGSGNWRRMEDTY
ncbi:hypothetical protein BDZ89DRAFT_441233 [Hymenopellis radicata]|nr:hypothetical protein BDZ89DRAFT_441233 [Hymenopellis radicata]